jgi:hypothetical protein
VLGTLLSDRRLCRAVGARGRAFVSGRFDVAVMAQNYLQRYRSLLSGRGRDVPPGKKSLVACSAAD